jgi:hypothetical protein
VSEPVVPDAPDEDDVGWGDEVAADEREGSDEERLNAERPPHHDRD